MPKYQCNLLVNIDERTPSIWKRIPKCISAYVSGIIHCQRSAFSSITAGRFFSGLNPKTMQSEFFFRAQNDFKTTNESPLRTFNALKPVVELVRYEIWRSLPAVLTATAMIVSTTITSTELPSPMKGFRHFDWTGSWGMAKYSCTTRPLPALYRRAPQNDNDDDDDREFRFTHWTLKTGQKDDFARIHTFPARSIISHSTVDHMANDPFASVRI